MQTDFTLTDSEALLIDPWLSETGAFFGSWHQWPPNGHLRDVVRQRCAGKLLSIFLSHEYQDHFNQSTLRAFSSHPDCTVFIPAYKDKFLLAALGSMNLRTVELAEGAQAGTAIRFRIFVDDSGINHDSAIFVAVPGFTFFNQNDCKIFDRLPMLKNELGEVDYYSVQFSCANWHPACFALPEDQRRVISREKVLSKFRNVLVGAKILAPRFIVPAAGPAFFPFLAPGLNLGTGTIFVHQDQFDHYLAQNGIRNILYPRPGERIGEDSNRMPIPGPGSEDIERYRSSHQDVWEDIGDTFSARRFAEVLQRRLDLIANIALPPETPSIVFNWGPGDADWRAFPSTANAMHRPASQHQVFFAHVRGSALAGHRIKLASKRTAATRRVQHGRQHFPVRR